MTINYKQSQYQLFPDENRSPEEARRPHFTAARLSLSAENLVIFSIVSIMVVVVAFALGVERGRVLALRAAPAAAEAVATAVLPEVAAPVEAAAPVSSTGREVRQAEETKAPAAVAAVKSGAFTVQLASYVTEASAAREARNLKGKGYSAFTLPKGKHVILCVGNFQRREDASRMGTKLKNKYRDSYVRRL